MFILFCPFSDVHKMEKEQEVERERDRVRSTKYFEPKVNLSEPPPKVWICVSYKLQMTSN